MKLSDLVINVLQLHGVDTAFSITGGAAMHLNNSVGAEPRINVIYSHHEQASAMAAEGYARIAKKPALVVVTAGPGAINAMNGVFGAYTDSIPMIVVSGQARKNTQKVHYGIEELRQLGDQEAPILPMVAHLTKATFEVTHGMTAQEVVEMINSAYLCSISGRPGPVWIEIPVDVQALELNVDFDIATQLNTQETKFSEVDLGQMRDLYQKALRPVILLGSGVQISSQTREAVLFAESLGVPVLTAWAHDVIPSNHPLFIGRPGTIGTRPGNIVLQACDLLIVLGSRLNIRQISYNYENFAPLAKIVQVDIDSAELSKPFPKIDLPIVSDLREFFYSASQLNWQSHSPLNIQAWLKWCHEIRREYDVKAIDYPVRNNSINPYHLIPRVIEMSSSNSIIVCGNATACIVPFQTAFLRDGMSMFSNSGSASMGFDLPAAIGAAIAAPGRPVICFAGDGSIMMNIQELEIISNLKLNIKIILLENGGYLSIKQTQSNFFSSFYGSTPESGVTFPDFEKLSDAFGIESTTLEWENWEANLDLVLKKTGPFLAVANLDRLQEFEPRLKSRLVDGVIQTPTLDDMYPHLGDEVLSAIRSGIPK